MYSKNNLTDDNFDTEVEKICDTVDLPYSAYNSFVPNLDNTFILQINNGKPEWVSSKTVPNEGSNFRQALQQGQLAYQFNNGFLVFDYETIL